MSIPEEANQSQTDSSASTRGVKTRIAAYFRLVLSLLGGLLMLVMGFVLGWAFFHSNFVVHIAKWIPIAAGVVSAVAFVLAITLLIAKNYIVPSIGQSSKRLFDRLINTMRSASVIRNDEGSLSLQTPTLDEEQRKALGQDIEALMSGWIVARGYWQLLFVIGTLLGSALVTAQLVVLIEQTNRLAQQNTLITKQNNIIAQDGTLSGIHAELNAINTKAELDLAKAHRRYDEITRVLFESTSPIAQEYVLINLLPEAMIAPVTIINPDWKSPNVEPEKISTTTEILTITQYPNLQRLAEQLIMFSKTDRTERTNYQANATDDAILTGRVSSAILRAYHRLGNGEADIGDEETPSCVWDIIYDDNGSVYDDIDQRAMDYLTTGKIKLQKDILFDSYYGMQGNLYLDHIKQGQLAGANLAYANLRNAWLPGADLSFAQMTGADLSTAYLDDAIFFRANLDNANLSAASAHGAGLQEASLRNTDLQNAWFIRADFRLANLREAKLTGVNLAGAILTGTHLQGVDLQHAKLEGATLNAAQLQKAVLYGAQLNGAKLTAARLEGAVLQHAGLQGVDFSNAIMRCVDLTHADLRGANLSGAHLQGSDMRSASLQGANLKNALLESGELVLHIEKDDRPYWVSGIQTNGVDERKKLVMAIPPSCLDGISVGSGWVFNRPEPPDSLFDYSDWLDVDTAISQAFAVNDLKRVFWTTKEDAIYTIRDRLGEQYLRYIVEVPTQLKGARFQGILISKSTILSISDNSLDVSIDTLRKMAESDSSHVEQWGLLEIPEADYYLGVQSEFTPTTVINRFGTEAVRLLDNQ